MKRYEIDAATFTTTNPDEFNAFLTEREANASWVEEAVGSIELIPGADDVWGIGDAAKSETKYSITTGTGQFALRDIAFPSLLERARISGYALTELSAEDVALIVTKCLHTSSDTTWIRMQDGKVAALMANTVKKLPQPELYEIAGDVSYEEFSGHMTTASWTHCMTTAKYETKADCGDFKALFEGSGMNFSDVVLGITVTTSDTGYSGANIYPSLVGIVNGKKVHLPILGEISMPHKGKASIELFKENLSLCFAKLGESKKRIEELANMDLNYPFNAFCNALKKAGIGKKAAKDVIDLVAAIYGNHGDATAADLYFRACEIPTHAEDEMTELTLMEGVAKFLKFTNAMWTKEFDRPVNCWSFSAMP